MKAQISRNKRQTTGKPKFPDLKFVVCASVWTFGVELWSLFVPCFFGFEFSPLRVRPSSYIGTGNSRDMVEIADCRFSGLSVRLRGGDDGLFIDRTVWSRPDVSLDAGDGGNTIYIDGTTPS